MQTNGQKSPPRTGLRNDLIYMLKGAALVAFIAFGLPILLYIALVACWIFAFATTPSPMNPDAIPIFRGATERYYPPKTP